MNNYIASYFVDRGYEVDYCLLDTSESTNFLVEDYKKTYSFNEVFLGFSSELKRNLNKYDLIVHSGHLMEGTYEFMEYLENLDTPLIIYTHGKISHGHRKVAKLCSRNKNAVTFSATNHEIASLINSGVSSLRTYKVHNIVDFEYREGLVSHEDDRRGVILSRVVRQKGINNSYEVAKKLNTTIDVYGNSNTRLYNLNIKPYEDHVEYKGYVDRDQVVGILRKKRFSIFLPNSIEGNTLFLLESMASGTPVITWDDWGFPDFVDSKYNILIPRTDNFPEVFESKFMDKLDYYLDYDRRVSMSKETINKFGKKHYYEVLDEYVDEILERGD